MDTLEIKSLLERAHTIHTNTLLQLSQENMRVYTLKEQYRALHDRLQNTIQLISDIQQWGQIHLSTTDSNSLNKYISEYRHDDDIGAV